MSDHNNDFYFLWKKKTFCNHPSITVTSGIEDFPFITFVNFLFSFFSNVFNFQNTKVRVNSKKKRENDFLSFLMLLSRVHEVFFMRKAMKFQTIHIYIYIYSTLKYLKNFKTKDYLLKIGCNRI